MWENDHMEKAGEVVYHGSYFNFLIKSKRVKFLPK
jgi:hypothetical protein